MTTITIPPSLGYDHPPDGFDQLDFVSGPQQKGYISATTVAPANLSVSGTASYDDGSTEVALPLVPALRPFHNAALHVVGRPFVDAIPLIDRRVQRFL